MLKYRSLWGYKCCKTVKYARSRIMYCGHILFKGFHLTSPQLTSARITLLQIIGFPPYVLWRKCPSFNLLFPFRKKACLRIRTTLLLRTVLYLLAALSFLDEILAGNREKSQNWSKVRNNQHYIEGKYFSSWQYCMSSRIASSSPSF